MGVHPVHAALTTKYVQTLIRIKARAVARQPGFSQSDQDDLEQDLAIHVLKQAHYFDPDRGSVRTFIARVVDSAVAMMLRDRRRLKRDAGPDLRSLDRDGVGHGCDHQPVLLREVIDDVDHRRRHRTYGPTPEEQRSLALDAAGLLANLPAGLREIAARMAGSNEAHVARELGVSRRQVRKAVEAIRQHFEAAGLVKD